MTYNNELGCPYNGNESDGYSRDCVICWRMAARAIQTELHGSGVRWQRDLAKLRARQLVVLADTELDSTALSDSETRQPPHCLLRQEAIRNKAPVIARQIIEASESKS